MEEAWKDYEKIWKNIQEEESIKQTTNAAFADVLGYSGYMRLHCYTSLLAVWRVNMCDVWSVNGGATQNPWKKTEKTDGIRPKMAQATKPIFRGPLPTGQPDAGNPWPFVGHPRLRWKSIQRLERGYFDTSTYTSKTPRCESTTRKNPCHQPFLTSCRLLNRQQASNCLLGKCDLRAKPLNSSLWFLTVGKSHLSVSEHLCRAVVGLHGCIT